MILTIQSIFTTEYNAPSIPQQVKFKLYPTEDQTDLQKKNLIKISTQRSLWTL